MATDAMDDGLTLTPRLVAIEALARREAELWAVPVPTAAHVAWAMAWLGSGAAGSRLAEALRDDYLEAALTRAADDGQTPRLIAASALLGAAADEAAARGHGFVGAEHALLGLARQCPEWLSEAVGGAAVAERLLEDIRALVDGWDASGGGS